MGEGCGIHLSIGEELGEDFYTGTHFFAPGLLFEPILMAALFPLGEITRREVFAAGTEVLANGFVGDSVQHFDIDLGTDVIWEAGDFATAGER